MAITPNASTGVVLRQDGGVFALNVGSGAPTPPVMLPAPEGSGQVAADPADSTKAFVAGPGGVFRINLGPGAPTADSILGPTTFTAQSVAVSPDSQTVYGGGSEKGSAGAGGPEAVAAVPPAGGNPILWSRVVGPNIGTAVSNVALTPDGKRLFGADGASVFGLTLPLAATETANPSVSWPGPAPSPWARTAGRSIRAVSTTEPS